MSVWSERNCLRFRQYQTSAWDADARGHAQGSYDQQLCRERSETSETFIRLDLARRPISALRGATPAEQECDGCIARLQAPDHPQRDFAKYEAGCCGNAGAVVSTSIQICS